MSKTLPKISFESVGQIERYEKAMEKAEAKGIKNTVIQKTVARLKFRDLIPRPRPQNSFAANKDLMLDREKNSNGNLDVRLKVSYQKRPNSIGQVLVPIDLYELVNEHPNQKKASALLLDTVKKRLLKSCDDGNVYLVCCNDRIEVAAAQTKKGIAADPTVKKKKKVAKKKSAVGKDRNLVATKIPSDRILKRVTDPKLGNFKYREDFYDYLCTSVEWCGQTIQFNLSVEEPTDTVQRFKDARKVWRAQKRWQKNCINYAAKELLGFANECLKENERKSITSTVFKKRIRLTSIEFFEDGDISFWYDTEELFYKKGICVQANVSGEFFEATND